MPRVTLFEQATPATVNVADSASVVLGVKFHSIDRRQNPRHPLLQVGRQHRHPRRRPLEQHRHRCSPRRRSTGETASGWQEATFATPVSIAANTTYVAGYLAPKGHYSATASGFAAATKSAPLTGLAELDQPQRALRLQQLAGLPDQLPSTRPTTGSTSSSRHESARVAEVILASSSRDGADPAGGVGALAGARRRDRLRVRAGQLCRLRRSTTTRGADESPSSRRSGQRERRRSSNRRLSRRATTPTRSARPGPSRSNRARWCRKRRRRAILGKGDQVSERPQGPTCVYTARAARSTWWSRKSR